MIGGMNLLGSKPQAPQSWFYRLIGAMMYVMMAMFLVATISYIFRDPSVRTLGIIVCGPLSALFYFLARWLMAEAVKIDAKEREVKSSAAPPDGPSDSN
jgi:hypothetical protein